jgi:hypothetical protein
MVGSNSLKVILIQFLAVIWIHSFPASAKVASSSFGQQSFSGPTVLACGGGGSDSERRPKRPGHHQQKTATTVDPSPQPEVKP